MIRRMTIALAGLLLAGGCGGDGGKSAVFTRDYPLLERDRELPVVRRLVDEEWEKNLKGPPQTAELTPDRMNVRVQTTAAGHVRVRTALDEVRRWRREAATQKTVAAPVPTTRPAE